MDRSSGHGARRYMGLLVLALLFLPALSCAQEEGALLPEIRVRAHEWDHRAFIEHFIRDEAVAEALMRSRTLEVSDRSPALSNGERYDRALYEAQGEWFFFDPRSGEASYWSKALNEWRAAYAAVVNPYWEENQRPYPGAGSQSIPLDEDALGQMFVPMEAVRREAEAIAQAFGVTLPDAARSVRNCVETLDGEEFRYVSVQFDLYREGLRCVSNSYYADINMELPYMPQEGMRLTMNDDGLLTVNVEICDEISRGEPQALIARQVGQEKAGRVLMLRGDAQLSLEAADLCYLMTPCADSSREYVYVPAWHYGLRMGEFMLDQGYLYHAHTGEPIK